MVTGRKSRAFVSSSGRCCSGKRFADWKRTVSTVCLRTAIIMNCRNASSVAVSTSEELPQNAQIRLPAVLVWTIDDYHPQIAIAVAFGVEIRYCTIATGTRGKHAVRLPVIPRYRHEPEYSISLK